MNLLVLVETKKAAAGVEIAPDGRIVRAAPIWSKFVGQNIRQMAKWKVVQRMRIAGEVEDG